MGVDMFMRRTGINWDMLKELMDDRGKLTGVCGVIQAEKSGILTEYDLVKAILILSDRPARYIS